MARPAMRTFLFSDIRDYTVFIETHGDAAASKMIRGSRRIIRAEVAKHRGAEIKTEGDSFYIVFHSTSSAVRCAVAIMRRAVEFDLKHPDLPIRLAIGIHTGEAVPHDRGYVGSAVIVAQRLCAQARSGQILVSDTVRSLVSTAGIAPMRDLGTWTVKGLATPVRVHEVEARSHFATSGIAPVLRFPAVLDVLQADPNSGIVISPELVQREAQLGALRDQLAAAARGETRIVAVSGEAGIGKSRLVRELARVAHEGGFYVLAGRSHSARALPYEPFVAALRPYVHARGTEIIRRQLGGLSGELGRLLPELDLDARPQGSNVAENVAEEERRDRFMRTIHLVLEDAAAQRPVLLVLEDFHDADAASRDLLRHFAAAMRSGLCVIFTFREEELDQAHPLRGLLLDLDRERVLGRVRLGRLDRDGVQRMAAVLLPQPVDAELTKSLFERSQGIPFYVEELVKTFLDDPSGALQTTALPATVRESVRVRLSRLVETRGAGVAQLLEALAVAGIPVTYDVLVRLSGHPEREAVGDIAAAVDAQLLERMAAKTETYQFRHALTREAVEDAIPQQRRRTLHALVAQVFEGTDGSGPGAAMIARHFAAAGESEKALRYARTGARNAIRVGAYAAATDLLEEALDHARARPEEAEVLEELAGALQASGRASDARAAIDRALGLVEVARDVARLEVRRAHVLRMEGRRRDAIAAAQRAIEILEAGGGRELAEAVVTHATLLWAENEAVKAAEVATAALALGRELNDPRIVVPALTVLGAASTRLGRDSTDRIEEAIRLGVEAGLAEEVVTACLELARAHQRQGRWEEARLAGERGLEVARSSGLEFSQARLLGQLTYSLLTQGRISDARRVAEQAVALARPGTIAALTAKTGLAHIIDTQGDHAEAVALFDSLAPQAEADEPDRRIIFLAHRARALAGVGRLDEAKTVAQAGLGLTLSRVGSGTTGFLNALEVAEARDDLEWVIELQGTFERYFTGRDTGPIRVVRLELEAVRLKCRRLDASEQFEAVADAYQTIGVVHRAVYRRACAAIERVRKPSTRAAARRDLRRLREKLVVLGALAYAERIDRALKAPSGRPKRPAALPLGARKLRVALLLSRGATDRRIARELRVSPAAAAGLVSRVLATLGVTTRSQVASWVVERRAVRSVAEARP